jgi:hypothetical protein
MRMHDEDTFFDRCIERNEGINFSDKNASPPHPPLYIYIVGVVEWSRVLDVRLSEWCCSVSMVWIQIPSREEQKFDSSKF